MRFSSFRFSIFFLLLMPLNLTNAYYYCGKEIQKKLCGNSKHFICHPETVPRDGKLIALAPMTKKLKRIFVDAHNEFRNTLAGGHEKFKDGGRFPIATRMREMLWDDELAYIAGQHASRCHMKHDKCHATERFPGSGQNLYISSASVMPKNLTGKALNAVNVWWNECKLVNDGAKLADKLFDGVDDWMQIGHFSAIANERAAFVGCGIALCEKCKEWKYCVEITCNYSKTNLLDTFMYKKGEAPASECDFYESTPSEKYQNLCVNTGKLFNDV